MCVLTRANGFGSSGFYLQVYGTWRLRQVTYPSVIRSHAPQMPGGMPTDLIPERYHRSLSNAEKTTGKTPTQSQPHEHVLESYPSLVSSREAGAIFRVRIWVVVFILKVGYILMLMLQSKLGDDSAERKKSP